MAPSTSMQRETSATNAGATRRPPITPRRMRFPFEQVTSPYFYDDNAIISAFIAALSAMFPPGEEEFVASVRHYADQIKDPALQKSVRSFIGQEAHHADQHRRANRLLDNLGFQATRLQKHLQNHIDVQIEKATPAQRLASTVAMEHITAVLAHHMLSNPEVLDPLPVALQDLLKWHAVEEIEHKSVAFDVYEQCVDSRKLLRIVFGVTVTEFMLRTLAYQTALLVWNRKMPSPREWLGAAKFFWGRKGVMTISFRPVLQFLEEGFRPWDIDDAHLVEAWIAAQETATQREAA